jgi:hypothetical protein
VSRSRGCVVGEPDEAWSVVHEAILAFGSKVPDLGKARAALLRVIQSGAWRHYVPPIGKPCDPPSFREWVAAKVPRGLETTEANLYEIAEGHTKLYEALDVELQRDHGGNRRSEDFKNNNVHLETDRATPEGNSQARALRRLRKDAPELHAEVLAGRLTPHAAMVKAGFRRRTVSIPVDKPESVAKTLRKNLAPEDMAALVRLLCDNT